MDISNLVQFDGNFAKKNPDNSDASIDKNVSKKYAADDVKTIRANTTQSHRGKAVDPKIWYLLNGLFGVGKYEISLGSIKDGGYAEVFDVETGNTQVCYLQKVNGTLNPMLKFKACEIGPLEASQDYAVGHKGTALLSAFIAFRYDTDNELREFIENYKNFVCEDPNSTEWDKPTFASGAGIAMAQVTNNLYYSLKNEFEISSTLERLRNNELDIIGQKIQTVPFGEVKKVKKAKASGKGNKGMYDLNPARTLSAEEQALVPTMPDSFKWQPWMFTLAQDIRDSRRFAEPINVVMLYGPSGSGKSRASAAICSLLNRPYVTFTCGPDTDEYSIIGGIQPNTREGNLKDKAFDSLCKEQGIPTFEDVAFDFEGSWEKLFGTKPDAYSEASECYNEIVKRVKWPSEKDFQFIPSPILTALHKGWAVEIQEVKIIKRSTVLVELNSLFEKEPSAAMFTLPNGEVWHRHPESFVLLTTNMNYEGCKNIQQSVLSRIDEIREVDTPDVNELLERALANTGCKDKKSVKTMAQLVIDIAKQCEDDDITDGVCGTRELQSWIKKAMLYQLRVDNQCDKLDEEVIAGAAFPTIIAHVSQNGEDQEHIITEVIAKKFKQTVLDVGRRAYLDGLV